MLQLAADRAVPAGFCSARGAAGELASSGARRRRVPAGLRGVDLLAATLKRLSMFVLRAAVQAQRRECTAACCGRLVFEAAAVRWAIWRSGLARHRRGARSSACPTWTALPRALRAGNAPASPSVIDAGCLALARGRQRCSPDRGGDGDQFVPADGEPELVGGVDFQGLLPRPEVVARSQYRGTLKRRSSCSTCLPRRRRPGDFQ